MLLDNIYKARYTPAENSSWYYSQHDTVEISVRVKVKSSYKAKYIQHVQQDL